MKQLDMDEVLQLLKASYFVCSNEEIEHMEKLDFGLGRPRQEGAQILTLASTDRMALKLIVLLPGQIEPEHSHLPNGDIAAKQEILRVLYGDMDLYVEGAAAGVDGVNGMNGVDGRDNVDDVESVENVECVECVECVERATSIDAIDAVDAVDSVDSVEAVEGKGVDSVNEIDDLKESGSEDLSSVGIPEDSLPYYTCKQKIHLEPGRQALIEPPSPHWFKAGQSGCVALCISTVAFDSKDQFTNPNVKR